MQNAIKADSTCGKPAWIPHSVSLRPSAHAAMSHAVPMGREPGRKPLLRGRGVLQLEDFCRSTGLDPATVENLMRAELFDISMWKDEELTRPFGLFDDVLPSRRPGE